MLQSEYDSLASEGAAVTRERRHPDTRGDLLAIQPSEFGEVGEELTSAA